ncbi:MAG: metal-dependent hydrolase [Bacteroidota bacterium]
MPTVLGHTFAAVALGSTVNRSVINWKLWTLGIIAAIIPDADVIAFRIGIPYESIWGHRGFSHSFLFALIVGLFFAYIFYNKSLSIKSRLWLITYFFLCTASHTILDAMTSGGLGVAFFFPFDNTRHFLPWRPVKVSPLALDSFMTDRGLKVIMSELIWIGIPSLFLIIVSTVYRKIYSTRKSII